MKEIKPFGMDCFLYHICDGNLDAYITNFGASLVKLIFKNEKQGRTDVVLGYDCAEDYMKYNSNQGGTIGRYGNRIAFGKFILNGKEYRLNTNDGSNHLHGGNTGFNKRIWSVTDYNENSVTMSYLSKDGEENYPGNLNVRVTYTVKNYSLVIEYYAVSDKDTIVNLTNHSYFRLGCDPMATMLKINSDYITEINNKLIPTGGLMLVSGTPFDFRSFKPIGRDINSYDEQIIIGKGYDHNFILSDKKEEIRLAAEAYGADSGIYMKVYTDMPAVQLYTANFLDGSEIGKNGSPLKYRSGFCLETQFSPNTPNMENFPSCILHAYDEYKSTTIYGFSEKI